MDYENAVNAVRALSKGGVARVSFVTPFVSACLAAAKLAKQSPPESFSFSSEATGYAENSGLRYHLGLTDSSPSSGAREGLTYCQVAKLMNPAEVETCNTKIGSFLRTQLRGCANRRLINATCGVVGELHDNIASHADGCGFSAAQMYRGRERVIRIGIADCGYGLNGSVQRSGRSMTDLEAIEWCLQRGNTTARKASSSEDVFGPQRLPEDCLSSPYPDHVETTSNASHHMGEGLYRLTELVAKTGGNTLVWSGSAQILYSSESRIPKNTDVHWLGTAIEIELPVAAFEACQAAVDRDEFESLAKRLNL